MGFQFDVTFIDCFMDDVIYVRDAEICVEHMICCIPIKFKIISHRFYVVEISLCKIFKILKLSCL